jgi:hypothetical protein
MKIYFKDNCTWFERSYEPTDDDRRVLAIVTEKLPDIPMVVPITIGKVEYALRSLYRDIDGSGHAIYACIVSA